MMRIVHSAPRSYPALGGVEDYVFQLSRRLAPTSQISVYSSNLASHHSFEPLDAPIKQEIDSVHFQRFPVWPCSLRSYKVSRGLFKALLSSGADLFHAHSFMYHSADAAAVSAKLKGKPLLFNPYLADMGAPSLLGKIYRKTFGALLMRADALVVISEYERSLLESWGYQKVKRIEEIPPGLDFEEFEAPSLNRLESLGFKDRPVIFSAGRIDRTKGLDVLIEAAPRILKECHDAAFVIAGADFGHLVELKRMVKDFGLDQHVQFIGRVSREELISLYAEATVFAFPTRFEAFGIVAAEAMAAGTPVVASNATAVPYVVKDGHSGLLFEQDNVQDFAQKVLDFLKNPQLCLSFSKQARAYARKRFDWAKSAQALLKLYEHFA